MGHRPSHSPDCTFRCANPISVPIRSCDIVAHRRCVFFCFFSAPLSFRFYCTTPPPAIIHTHCSPFDSIAPSQNLAPPSRAKGPRIPCAVCPCAVPTPPPAHLVSGQGRWLRTPSPTPLCGVRDPSGYPKNFDYRICSTVHVYIFLSNVLSRVPSLPRCQARGPVHCPHPHRVSPAS